MKTAIESAKIDMRVLFLNADSGFDAHWFQGYYFQNEIIDNIDQKKE